MHHAIFAQITLNFHRRIKNEALTLNFDFRYNWSMYEAHFHGILAHSKRYAIAF